MTYTRLRRRFCKLDLLEGKKVTAHLSFLLNEHLKKLRTITINNPGYASELNRRTEVSRRAYRDGRTAFAKAKRRFESIAKNFEFGITAKYISVHDVVDLKMIRCLALRDENLVIFFAINGAMLGVRWLPLKDAFSIIFAEEAAGITPEQAVLYCVEHQNGVLKLRIANIGEKEAHHFFEPDDEEEDDYDDDDAADDDDDYADAVVAGTRDEDDEEEEDEDE